MKKIVVFIGLAWMLCFATVHPSEVSAAENGIGHYSPGGMASFIDVAPPGFAVFNFFNYYNGSAGGDSKFPFGGLVAANLDVTTYADVIGLAYRTPFGILDGKFIAAMLVPYVWAEVKADVDLNRRLPQRDRAVSKRDTTDGIGDITLIPFWLAWNKGDFKWDVRFDIYAPTGDFTKGKLANVGLNYWTFEPVVSFSYLSSKIGLEVSAFAGLNFNTENDATDYQSGDVFHLDLTVAEHLPLSRYGVVGVGFNAFYWEQFTGDSGAGAVLGSFKGRTQGIGPVVSYVSPPICGHTILAELKWLPELDVNNRLEGDYIWFKAVLAF
jgi:hypothetical protein